MLTAQKVKNKYVVGAVIIIVLVAGYLFYQYKKDNFLHQQLAPTVAGKSKQLYHISYDSIVVDEIAGNLYIKNLHVQGDTSVQLDMIKRGDTSALKSLIEARIPLLRVENFKTAKALLSKKLECENIIIENPAVTVFLFPGQVKKTSQQNQEQEIYEQLLGNFNLIKAQSVVVNHASVTGRDYYSGDTKFAASNTSIHLTDVQVDSSANADTSRTFFCKEIAIGADTLALGQGAKSAIIQKFGFSTRNKIVSVGQFDYDARKDDGNFSTTLTGIKIKGINYAGPIENADLTINEIELENGSLVTEKKNKNKSDSQKPATILNGWINSFSLNSLQIHSLKFSSVSPSAEASSISVTNNTIELKKLYIDRKALLNSSLINQADEIVISNKLISLTNSKGFYKTNIENLLLNTKTKKVSMGAFRLQPLLNETAFAKKAGKQKDRYDIAFRNINCSQVNFERLLDGEINIATVATSNNSIKIFHDMNYPIDSASKEDKHLTFPHQKLFLFNQPISVGRFTANNTYIEYKEKNAKSKNTGRVRFSNANLSIADISNKPDRKTKQIPVKFSANFLDKIPVEATIAFYTNDWKKGRFAVTINEKKTFDATVLNELTQPLALQKIDHGTVHSIQAEFQADTSSSSGSIKLIYDNLKVTLLKKDGVNYDSKGLLSFLTNILVKNKNEAVDPRIGKINFERDPYRSFFNFIWKSIFSGTIKVIVFKP